MFRIPPSPFNLKKPFSPTGNRPLKIQSRRLSNTSDERASPIATALETHDEEIVRESEVEDVDPHERSGTNALTKSVQKSSAKKHKGDTTLSEDDQVVEDSFVADVNEKGEKYLIEDSFLQQLRRRPVVTPLQATNKRKRNKGDSQHDKSSSKHKKSRKSNEPDISFDLPSTSINLSSPANANVSQITELPEPTGDEQDEQTSKKQRKEERRKRKEERKKEKEEGKKRKIESTSSGTMNPLDHDQPQNESQIRNPINEVQATQEEPAQPANAAPQQEAIELDENSLDLGRPAIPKNKKQVLEIPATQNPQQQPNPPPSNPSYVQPFPEEQVDEQLPSLPQQKNQHTKPMPKSTKRKRTAPSKSSPKKSRKLVSNEKILDSSASDEEHDPEPKPKPKTTRKRTIKPQPPDPDPIRSTSPDAEPRSTVQKVGLGRFSLEEDKRLLRVAKACRVEKDMSVEEFAENIMDRKFVQELADDLKPEDWGGRNRAVLHNRLRRLMGLSKNPRAPTGKGVYTPQENDLIDRTVKAFRLARGMGDSELSAFLEEDLRLDLRKRQTEDMCRDLAAKLPGRNITSLTRHLINRFVEKSMETWTSKDDATLRKLVTQNGKQWKVIAEQMGRKPELVRLRYRDYASLGKTRVEGKWEHPEEKKLYKTVLEALKGSEWQVTDGLSLEVVSQYVNWGIISGKVGNRGPSQCRDKWTRLDGWQPLETEKKSSQEEADDGQEADEENDLAEDGQEEVEEDTDSEV